MDPRTRALLLVGVLLVSFNFRPSITSIPPVIEPIRADVHLGYAAVSLLTTIPTVLVGLFAFVATPISRWAGRERAIFWAAVLVALSTFLRIWGANVVVLVGSTVLVGVGIAISQALLPPIVLEHFSDRAALVTGLYTTSLGLGAAAAAGGTAILADVLGSWPAALAFWGLPAVLAAAVFVPIVRAATPPSPGSVSSRGRLPWRDRGAWMVTAFFSADCFLYFSLLAWIAPAYIDLGWSAERAGFLLTLFIVAQLSGSLGISVLADRWQDRRPWLALTIAMTGIGLVGVVRYPFVSPWGWISIAGVGVGGLFALNLTLPVDLARDASVADRLTPMVLGVGYVVGSAGPFVTGLVRESLGRYDPAFVGLVGLTLVMMAMTVWFRPDRSVE